MREETTKVFGPTHGESACEFNSVQESPLGAVFVEHTLSSTHGADSCPDANSGAVPLSSVGNLLENQSELVSRGSIQRIRMEPEFLSTNEQNPKQSTASQMVHWSHNRSRSWITILLCLLPTKPISWLPPTSLGKTWARGKNSIRTGR